MAGNLTFRLSRPDDVPGILRLWNEDSGWGGISEQQFYDWYVNTPHGECLIALAVDEDNNVVGQEVFTPTKVYVGGVEKKALRFSAPILAKEFSAKLGIGSHPTVEMFKVAGTAAIKNGYGLIYAFPARAWLRFISLFTLPELGKEPGIAGEFDCYAISLESPCTFVEEIYDVRFAKEFNEEYDQLWQSAKNDFPVSCGIVRNLEWLNWRLKSHLVLEVRRKDNGQLSGYAAFKKRSGLLVDALARNHDDLETTITAAIGSLCQSALAVEAGIEEIKVMKTPATAPVVEKLNFRRVKFKFAFWCYSIDATIPIKSVEPSRWFLMPKD